MFIGFIIGALGGLATFKFFKHRAQFVGVGGHGCHRGGGRHGMGRRGGFGPRGIWRAIRYLDLSPGQRRSIHDLYEELHESLWQARHAARAEVTPLVEALSGDTFDRARVEEVAGRQTASFEKVKKHMVDAAERLHAILIPEQRTRLREILAQWTGASSGGSEAGPYRTV